MARFSRMLRSMAGDENGATMVEYGMMVALIAAVCIAIVSTLGGQIQAAFNTVSAGV